nr:hypothetical protein [bacterium]
MALPPSVLEPPIFGYPEECLKDTSQARAPTAPVTDTVNPDVPACEHDRTPGQLGGVVVVVVVGVVVVVVVSAVATVQLASPSLYHVPPMVCWTTHTV